MKYYGLYSESGLGVYMSRSKLRTALSYLPGAYVRVFNDSREAIDYTKRNYNLLIEQIEDEAALFPMGAEMIVNRTYFKSELKEGRVNYEF